MLADITWSKIKQGNYAITEYGDVYSYYKQDYMKTKIDKDGYKTICLVTSDGRRSSFGIHRLLMVTFKPCKNMNELVVNHIDGNKQNNSLDNLEWVTSSENVHLAYVDGLANTKGENHGRAKFTEKEVIEILKMIKEGKSTAEIKAVNSKVTRKDVYKLRHNISWTHLPR